MSILPNVSWQKVTQTEWDVVVVGAGPAGSLVARQLALEGLQVLLVDKEPFPRWKVCGCCLNANALSTLRSVGLADLAPTHHAVPLSKIHLAMGKQSAHVNLQENVALSRETFDAALIESAIRAGVFFLPQTFATYQDQSRELTCLSLNFNGDSASCRSQVILAADGLGGRLLSDNADFNGQPASRSRMGLGTTVRHFPPFYEAGVIFMATGQHGYVGMVRLEDGRLNIAAAFDRKWIKQCRGPGSALAILLQEVSWPSIPSLGDRVWRGTPLLTRQSKRVAGERLFVLGDASGYVEPFTGEGIAWALSSGVALASLAARAARQWQTRYADQWTYMHGRLVRDRQRACRVVAWGLRHPGLVRTCLALLSRYPALASPLVRHLNRPAPVKEPHEFHHPGHGNRASRQPDHPG
jgi:menaquinone-9 beta-reductase